MLVAFFDPWGMIDLKDILHSTDHLSDQIYKQTKNTFLLHNNNVSLICQYSDTCKFLIVSKAENECKKAAT